MMAQIVALHQSIVNFNIHIPPQAKAIFYPFIFRMTQVFEARGMLRGRGKKPE
jgi:hypothetical protein